MLIKDDAFHRYPQASTCNWPVTWSLVSQWQPSKACTSTNSKLSRTSPGLEPKRTPIVLCRNRRPSTSLSRACGRELPQPVEFLNQAVPAPLVLTRNKYHRTPSTSTNMLNCCSSSNNLCELNRWDTNLIPNSMYPSQFTFQTRTRKEKERERERKVFVCLKNFPRRWMHYCSAILCRGQSICAEKNSQSTGRKVAFALFRSLRRLEGARLHPPLVRYKSYSGKKRSDLLRKTDFFFWTIVRRNSVHQLREFASNNNVFGTSDWQHRTLPQITMHSRSISHSSFSLDHHLIYFLRYYSPSSVNSVPLVLCLKFLMFICASRVTQL